MVYALREGVAATLLAAHEDFEPALKLLFNENITPWSTPSAPRQRSRRYRNPYSSGARCDHTLATYTLVSS
jgi:hypothetical protein